MSPRAMTASGAMDLLVNAARVDPVLRDAALQVSGEVDRLRRVIERYGQHDDDCAWPAVNGGGSCDCGFEACEIAAIGADSWPASIPPRKGPTNCWIYEQNGTTCLDEGVTPRCPPCVAGITRQSSGDTPEGAA